MTSSLFLRFVWKEYRVQRPFWIGILSIAFFLQLVIVYFAPNPAGRIEGLYFAALLAVPFYVLGAGAVLFAGEREEGTDELLRVWAAPAGRLLLGKLCFALASAAALLVVMLALAWVLAGGGFPKDGPASWGRPAAVMALMACELGAWSLFWSCLTRRAVNAACFAAGAWTIEIAIFAQTLNVPMGMWDAGTLDEAVGLFARLPLVAVLLLVDLLLVARWLRPARAAWLAHWSWSALVPAWPRIRRAAKADSTPPWRRTFQRLLWHEWRQSTSSALVLIGIGVAAMLVFEVALAFVGLSVSGLLIPVAVTLLGALAFGGEQTERRFTFLGNRGIAPPAVWLSKQLVGLAWAALAVAVFVLVSELLLKVQVHYGLSTRGHELLLGCAKSLVEVGYSPRHRPVEADPADVFAMLLLALILCFSTGQLASLFIPRSVPASFVALLATGFVLAWTFFMAALRVPLWLGALPLALACFAASYFRTNDWLLERSRPRGWLGVGAAFLAPLVVMAGGTAVYRVIEIPARVPNFDVAAFLAKPLAPDEQATAALYREAMSKLAPYDWQASVTEDQPGAFGGWERAAPWQRAWFEKSQEALPIVLEAANRPSCALRHPQDVQPFERDGDITSMALLARLLLLSARGLEADGQLDEAFERYMAALRVAAHAASRGDEHAWWTATHSRAMVYGWMSAWMSHPQQTPQRLTAALRRIQADLPGFPSLADAIKASYLAERKALAGDWKWLEALFPPGPFEFSVRLVRLFPWERQRALRLSDWSAAERLKLAGYVQSALDQPGAALVGHGNASRRHNSLLSDWHASTLPLGLSPVGADWFVLDVWINVETDRRALLVKLALVAYRAEHGRLPERLEDLVGTYFDRLPLDPWNGRPFGYEPKGFPNPVEFGRPTGFIARPGQPLLWSAGVSDARLVSWKPPNGGRVLSVLTDPIGFDSQRGGYQTQGIAYPIP